MPISPFKVKYLQVHNEKTEKVGHVQGKDKRTVEDWRVKGIRIIYWETWSVCKTR
jgi:hypothetical protein